MKTICLNMIVKNESRVIRRCLEPLIPFIDSWVIVDTGSTDGTQKIVKEILRKIPGELHERPWVNFAHNRNEALDLARSKADYLLFIDADEILANFALDKNILDQDFYQIQIIDNSSIFFRLFLIDNDPGWFWEGAIHEYPNHTITQNGKILEGPYIDSRPRDGGRTQDAQKYLRDVENLKKELEKDPSNSRNVFYLAQSYGCAKDKHSALQTYEKRAEMGGDVEELFWALYCIGCIRQDLKKEPDSIVESYSRAYRFNTARAEPLYRLANYFGQLECPTLAFLIAEFAIEIPRPPQYLRAALHIYDYSLLFTYAECAFRLERYNESLETYRQLLTKPGLPADLRQIAEDNVHSLLLAK